MSKLPLNLKEKDRNKMNISKSEIFKITTFIKGIAILFVVILHSGSKMEHNSPIFNTICEFLTPFRMPIFILVSGFLYYYTTRDKYPEYSKFVKEKAQRLIVPLLTIKITYFFAKIAGSYLIADNFLSIESTPKSLIANIFIYPFNEQFAGFLWFVYVLFFIFCITHIYSHKIYLLTIASFILYFIPLPQEFCLQMIGDRYLFFCLGGILFRHLNHINLTKIRQVHIIILLSLTTITSFILYPLQGSDYVTVKLISLLKNIAAIMCIVSLAVATTYSRFENNIIIRQIAYIGSFSASIYFLHTLCIRIATVLFTRFYPINSESLFWTLLPLGIVAGLYGPLTLDKHLLSKSKIASTLILGKRTDLSQLTRNIRIFTRRPKRFTVIIIKKRIHAII